MEFRYFSTYSKNSDKSRDFFQKYDHYRIFGLISVKDSITEKSSKSQEKKNIIILYQLQSGLELANQKYWFLLSIMDSGLGKILWNVIDKKNSSDVNQICCRTLKSMLPSSKTHKEYLPFFFWPNGWLKVWKFCFFNFNAPVLMFYTIVWSESPLLWSSPIVFLTLV